VRTSLRLLVSLIIAAGLLAALFYWGEVTPAQLRASWAQLSASVYLQALAVHVGIYLLRAARFWVLLPPGLRPSVPALLAVSAAHNMASYVLPAKTGEGTLVLYLRKICGVPASEGLASLVVSRLLDLATLALLLSAATLVLAGRGVLRGAWALPLGGLLALGSLTLLALSARSDWLVHGLSFLMGLLRLGSTRLGARLSRGADRVAGALRAAGGEGRLVSAALLSLLLWMGVFSFFLFLARGFGLGEELGAVEGTFGSAWAVLANLLPINGFAGVGTQEGGWVIGFKLVGVDEAVALSSGLGAHLVQLANVVLFGVLGHLGMALVAPKSR
jgi:uncharacterized protein (TIRG00374 family)